VKLTRQRRLDSPSLGGLLATRQGAITLALLCALGATAILIFAIGKYRHSVSGATKQATVLVATSAIPKGMSADQMASQRMYKVTPVLASQVSAGAVVNAASLAGKVTAGDILPGQQLTAADFATGPVGVSGGLTSTERAVSVTVDSAHGAAGVLQAGDHVDVYASLAAPAPVVSLLVANAVVLKVPVGSSGGSGNTMLLGVSMQVSPRVMWVMDNGKVWLELRGLSATNPSPTATVLRDVLLGGQAAKP
jgi:pilus assembly protein CpaB